MARRAALLSAVVIGGLLSAACGDGDRSASTPAVPESSSPAEPSFQPAGSAASTGGSQLTKADARKLRSLAIQNAFVRGLAAGSRVSASKVVPWVSEGGEELIGGAVQVQLEPPVRIVDQRVPATISPNHKAPPGTPTLHRYARLSAADVGELEVAVELASGRVARIEPTGDGYTVTKLELIGPPPEDPAYASEPGY